MSGLEQQRVENLIEADLGEWTVGGSRKLLTLGRIGPKRNSHTVDPK